MAGIVRASDMTQSCIDAHGIALFSAKRNAPPNSVTHEVRLTLLASMSATSFAEIEAVAYGETLEMHQ